MEFIAFSSRQRGSEGRFCMQTYLMPAAVAAAFLFSAPVFAAAPAPQVAKPMFKVVPNDAPWHHAKNIRPGSPLVQWNGSFTDLTGKTVNYTMVGTDPSTTNQTTQIPVIIVPVKMVYGVANGNMTFDPKNQ